MRRPPTLRAASGLLAAAIGLGAVLATAAPAAACACGGLAPAPGEAIGVAQERAIVSWDGDRERIELALDLTGDAAAAGLILPTPTPADVASGAADVFAALEEAIAPVPTVAYDWWGSGGAGAAGATPPDVLARVQLGPLEATTLAASDAAGLTAWLDDNGFALSDAVAATLPDYVTRGWSFVAVRLAAADDAALAGGLDPLVVTFDSDALVYPMAMSRAATDAQSVRLYVVDDHRARAADLADATTTISQSWTVWAGDAPAVVADRGDYLTVVDLAFDDPATQITGDLVLTSAGDDAPLVPSYVETRPLAVLGIPAGFVAVLGGLALVPAAVAIGSLVLRGRTARRMRATRP